MLRARLAALIVLPLGPLLALACDDESGGDEGEALQSVRDVYERCCDEETQEFLSEIPECAEWADDAGHDVVHFCDDFAGGGGATPTQPFEVPIVGCENLDCSGVAEHTIEGCVEGLVEGRFAMTHLEIELETSIEQPLRWNWIAGTTQQVQPSVLSRYEFIMAADGWPQLGVAPIASNAEGDNVLLQFGVFEPSPNPDFREYRYWTGSAGAPDDLRDGWIAFFEVPAVEGDPVFGAYDYTVDVRHHPGGPNPPAAQGTIHVQACFRGTTY